jgi:hypothetical protein
VNRRFDKLNVTFHEHQFIGVSDDMLREATLVVCDNAATVDDARLLLDILGLHEQPEGHYARSDEELIAAGQVCLNGHPMNRKNARIKAGRRTNGCKAC